MEALLQSLVPWGLSVIRWVQSIHHPILDQVFLAITAFGSELGYILLLPLFYWCIDAQKGRRIGVLIFFSLGLNSFLKVLFHFPRPAADQVRQLYKASGLSFPSGHAQGSATLWGHVFALWNKTWVRVLAVFLIFSIGFSRIYLGVHYPQDVIVGWSLGILGVVLFVLLEPKITPLLTRTHFTNQLIIATVFSVGFFLLSPDRHHVPPCAGLLGFLVGIILERRFLRFSSNGTTRQRLMRFFAVVPVALLLLALKGLFPQGTFWRFLRYAFASFGAAFLAPWLFLQLKWAQTESPSNEIASKE
ncbi:MAG TPA: hypothetical protein DCE42_13240 [Myxococcales bacterium]|nr:hypothetical protein [Deltaproteobacteria bacterium]MBU48146.1 hypothetical protein [Deltaproteobacteria bacterium]HAA55721.1 hypothetical protein [Myxococcales bacterium]|tara:strand:+ start:19422 stop:20330 length:909 start_codon:yes stop_codon:yes gene_type:complete